MKRNIEVRNGQLYSTIGVVADIVIISHMTGIPVERLMAAYMVSETMQDEDLSLEGKAILDHVGLYLSQRLT